MIAGVVLVLVLVMPDLSLRTAAYPMPSAAACEAARWAYLASDPGRHETPAKATRAALCAGVPVSGRAGRVRRDDRSEAALYRARHWSRPVRPMRRAEPVAMADLCRWQCLPGNLPALRCRDERARDAVRVRPLPRARHRRLP